MPDQISTYRQIRLVLQVPPLDGVRTYWSLHAVGVRRGVPTSKILLDGTVARLSPTPTTEEILEALAAVVASTMLLPPAQ
jgi:hypothetical protein